MTVGHAELGGVDDLCAGERVLEPEIAVAGRERGEVADTSARQAVAERRDARHRQGERAEVEAVGGGDEHADVVAVGEQLPRAQVPRVGVVAAEEDDARAAHRPRSA